MAGQKLLTTAAAVYTMYSRNQNKNRNILFENVLIVPQMISILSKAFFRQLLNLVKCGIVAHTVGMYPLGSILQNLPTLCAFSVSL